LAVRRQGAQRASAVRSGTDHPSSATHRRAASAPRTPSPSLRSGIVGILIALVVLALPGAAASPVRAGNPALKAVIIVGPSSGSTNKYLDRGEQFARSAEAQGMDVRRIFHPRATWARVLDNIQGANLVVFLGHGNGWPSPYAPFNKDSKDGFGLNPEEGASAYTTKYYGENLIRDRIELAENAVVLLSNLCYASGNGEPGQAKPSQSVAIQRVDNYASGFLDAGARAVFAYGWKQDLDLIRALNTSDKTMDQLFMTEGSKEYYTGFVGWNDVRFDSERVSWARGHVDPHPEYGYYRGLTGDLTMTAAEWRGVPREPDTTAPTLSAIEAGVAPADASASDVTFSPNDDGIGDTLTVAHRVSEPADIEVRITDAAGTVVRTFAHWSDEGEGATIWDGRDDAGATVADGRYDVELTPRDASGNVGSPVTVGAVALTALRAPALSRPAINARDGDGLADSTTFTASLTRRAEIEWRILDADGRVVRSVASGSHEAGAVAWRWDGRDDSGAFVPNGAYTSRVTATTAAGAIRHTRGIHVGPLRLKSSDGTPARGQRVRFTIVTTEPLAAAPRVTFTQPGLRAYSVATERVDASRYRVIVTLRTGGTRGDMHISVTVTDDGGGTHRGSWTLPLG
jgi:flagellar hook assembly protein FlgD